MLARYLKKEGHFFQMASNGLEAIDKFKRFKFDLIFMDIEMPLLDGFEATRKIRQIEKDEQRPKTFIIGLSGNACTGDIDKAMSIGMDGYLIKPYRKEQIYMMIQKKLGAASLTSFNDSNKIPTEKCNEPITVLGSHSPVMRDNSTLSSANSSSFFTTSRPLEIDDKMPQLDLDSTPVIRTDCCFEK